MLPWSPVPVTGQTLAVLLAGVLLGRWWGGISLAIYAGLGIAGVPWFAGWGSGLGYLAGPTGGYIIGFILAALFLGHFTDTYIRSRSFLSMLALMLFANFILIYIPGLFQLGLWLNLVKGEPVTFTTLLSMGALPFIAGDITKAVIAAAIARGVTPKSAYNGEVDRQVGELAHPLKYSKLSCVTNHIDESAARQQPEAGFRMGMESMLVS
ncbi:hypothetical protein ES705_51088 [subsurface metagenome]